MKIKEVHAHFLISLGNYSNERIGFVVELETDETVESVVPRLRDKAKEVVGQTAEELYQEKYNLERTVRDLTIRLGKLRQEWDATAEFLRTQGIRPDAPPLPQFSNLLAGAKVEEESIEVVEATF
jgi:hypothetical protein